MPPTSGFTLPGRSQPEYLPMRDEREGVLLDLRAVLAGRRTVRRTEEEGYVHDEGGDFNWWGYWPPASASGTAGDGVASRGIGSWFQAVPCVLVEGDKAKQSTVPRRQTPDFPAPPPAPRPGTKEQPGGQSGNQPPPRRHVNAWRHAQGSIQDSPQGLWRPWNTGVANRQGAGRGVDVLDPNGDPLRKANPGEYVIEFGINQSQKRGIEVLGDDYPQFGMGPQRRGVDVDGDDFPKFGLGPQRRGIDVKEAPHNKPPSRKQGPQKAPQPPPPPPPPPGSASGVPGGGTSTVGGQKVGPGTVRCYPLVSGSLEPDKRYLGLVWDAPGPAGFFTWDGLPPHGGETGILLLSSREGQQHNVFMRTGNELIAHHRGANAPTRSTLVFDIGNDGQLSEDYVSSLETMMRVTRELAMFDYTDPQNWGSSRGTRVRAVATFPSVLAWECGLDHPGFFWDNSGGPANSAGFGGALAEAGETVSRDEDLTQSSPRGPLLGCASHWAGGPLTAGGAGDVHTIGVTDDGVLINSGHIRMRALFYADPIRDGPKEYTNLRYPVDTKSTGDPWHVYEGWDPTTRQWRRWTRIPFKVFGGTQIPLAPPGILPQPVPEGGVVGCPRPVGALGTLDAVVPGMGKLPHVESTLEVVAPGLQFRAADNLLVNAPARRWGGLGGAPGRAGRQPEPETRPIVAQLLAVGDQSGDSADGWNYTQRPCQGNRIGGTAIGHLLFAPPELTPADVANESSLPVGKTFSQSYVTLAPYMALGFGSPLLTPGAAGFLESGWRMSIGTTLPFDTLSTWHETEGSAIQATSVTYVGGEIGFRVHGKLTVDGLLDPTGQVDAAQATVPGGNPGAGKGAWWWKTGTPTTPWVTDSAGTDAQLLTSASTHALLSATHSDSLAAAVVRGALVIGNATPKWASLLIGATAGNYLRTDGTDPSWSGAPLLLSDGTLANNAYAFSGAVNTGMYRTAGGALWLSHAGVAMLAASTNLLQVPVAHKFNVVGRLELGGATFKDLWLDAASATIMAGDDAYVEGRVISAGSLQAVALLDGGTHSDTLAGSVVLGDLLHGNATPRWARLAGNTTTAKQFLSQTGTGVVSAVPAWGALVAGDIPDLSATYVAIAGAAWIDLTDGGASTAHKHDHGGQDGLGDDDHAQYALLLGRVGGQDLIGSTALGGALNLKSTSHATKGEIYFGASGGDYYDEVNRRLVLGRDATAAPMLVTSTFLVTNLNADLLDGQHAAAFAAAAHTHVKADITDTPWAWADVSKTGSSLADLATRSASDLATGTLALARGGTGADLSATGPGVLRQLTAGAVATALKHNWAAAVAPVATDDSAAGYAVGSFWFDTTADKAYCCLDATATAAVWTEITQGAGAGDVVGPGSATDNAIARFDTTTGKLIQDSAVTIADSGLVEVVYSSALTNLIDTALRMRHQTSGVAAAGFGLKAQFDLENAAGAFPTAGEIRVVWTDASATYDADFVWALAEAGVAPAERMRLTSAGALSVTDAATTRTNLGLAIGTNVQAYDAELAALAGLVSAADKLPYFTGLGTAALADFTAAGRALLDDADAAAQRTTLGLAIGSNVQAWDADLDELAALSDADSNFIVGSAGGWVAESGATARTSLGLGSIATQAANAVAITGGSVTGITDVTVADGGTGRSTATAYEPICGGTVATGPHQSTVAGSAGQVYTHNGPGALPTWQAAGGGSEWATLSYGGKVGNTSLTYIAANMRSGDTGSTSNVLTAAELHHGAPWAGTIGRTVVFNDGPAGRQLNEHDIAVDEVSVFNSGAITIVADESYEAAPGDAVALDDRIAVGVKDAAAASGNFVCSLLLQKSSPPKQCSHPDCPTYGDPAKRTAISTDMPDKRHTYWCSACDREVRHGVWDSETGLLREILADVTDPDDVTLCAGQAAATKAQEGRTLVPAGMAWEGPTRPKLRPGQRRVYRGGRVRAEEIPGWVDPQVRRETLRAKLQAGTVTQAEMAEALAMLM